MSPNFFLRLNISFFFVLGLLRLIFNKSLIKYVLNTKAATTILLSYIIGIFMLVQALYSYIGLRSKDKLIKKKIFNINILLISAVIITYSHYVIKQNTQYNLILVSLLMFILISNYIALKIFRKDPYNIRYNQSFVIFVQ